MSSGKLAELRKLRFRDMIGGHWCLKDAEAGEEAELIQKGCTEKRARHGPWK